MPARGKITAQMPRKWVPNAAKRSSGFHETQNAFCLVKAVIIDRAGTAVETRSMGLRRRGTWQSIGDWLIDDSGAFRWRFNSVRT
jgi:hypothetical protein